MGSHGILAASPRHGHCHSAYVLGLGQRFCPSPQPGKVTQMPFLWPSASVTHPPSPWSSERVSGALTGQDSHTDSTDWPQRTPHRELMGPNQVDAPVPSGLSPAELSFLHALWDFIPDLSFLV